ncbi:DUF1656 domain-containing protein [Rhabdochromatium marinum]|uniref:DUF1656 domain-containing protein n=1 Tax=Rhabdochromatium marinum TaxID=48729 RepID=UPI0019077388|nr:DUF1656 domain-containing protein [Rhabdochromatium marinum]MBK1647966.1 DUF1656 domain-containing protein [Rhabdochromatium marinum]
MPPFPAELSLNGLFIPPWLPALGSGWLLAWLLGQLANAWGLSRWIWHPPLFFLALVIACSVLMGATFFPCFG